MNYVLIDFENVHLKSINGLKSQNVRLLLFAGPSHSKNSTDLTASLLELPRKPKFIKLASNGPEAVDFCICYYIGLYSAKDPEAAFYVVSKDKGFAPLIEHLATRQISINRVESLSDIVLPASGPTERSTETSKSEDRLTRVLKRLNGQRKNRPATITRMDSFIGHVFNGTLPEAEVKQLRDALAKEKHLNISGTRITYPS